MNFTEKYPEFVTVACLNHVHFLRHDDCKRVLIDALAYRVLSKQVKVYGFVIMPNHFHIIWRVCDHVKSTDFKRDFLKYTARSILTILQAKDVELYNSTFVMAKDRKHQIWDKNADTKELFTDSFYNQKLDYIHNNPLQPQWQLANSAEEYYWSSAAFYLKGDMRWPFLTHCDE